MYRRTTARATALALLGLLVGCDLTLPWSSTDPTPDGGGGGGGGGGDLAFTISTRSLSATTYVGQAPPMATLPVHFTGQGTAYVGVDTTGAVIQGTELVSVPSGMNIRISYAQQSAPGTYTGTAVVYVCADANCNRQLAGSPVTVNVSVQAVVPLLQASPTGVSFRWVRGTTRPGPVEVSVTETALGRSLSVSPQVEYTGSFANWLGLSALSSPAVPGTLRLEPSWIDPNQVPTGLHQATVVFPGLALQLPVSIEVVEPVVQVSPASLAFSAVSSQPQLPAAATISATVSDDASFGLSAEVTYLDNSDWLEVSWLGSAPGPIYTVRPRTTGMSAGTKRASIAFRGPRGELLGTVPVTYTLSPLSITAAPTSFEFTAVKDQSAPPPAQSVLLSTPLDIGIYCSWVVEYAPGATDWLQLPNGGVSAPGALVLRPSRVDLAPGTYDAVMKLSMYGEGTHMLDVPITYRVGARTLSATPPAVELAATPATSVALEATLALSDGGTTVSYTVAAPSWLDVTPTAGSTATASQLQLSVPANRLGALNGQTLQGTIDVTYTTAGPAVPVVLSVPVTLAVNLPSVTRITPWTVVEGDPRPVVVRGTGLTGLQASWLRFGGLAAASVTAVSDTEVHAVLPALAPGHHAVSVPNGLGLATGAGALEVVAATPRAAASGPSRAGQRTAVIRDDLRGAVYAANKAGYLERWRDSTGLQYESIALPGIDNVALSPDGRHLVAIAGLEIWDVDPVAFTKPAAPARSLAGYEPYGTVWRIAFANDGYGLFVARGGGTTRVMRYDPATTLVDEAPGFAIVGVADLGASRDGGKVVVGENGWSLWTYDAGQSRFVDYGTYLTPVDRPVLDRTGRRLLTAPSAEFLRSGTFGVVYGTFPPGALAAVLTDDADVTLTFDGTRHVRRWDTSVTLPGIPAPYGPLYPELGTPGGIAPLVDPGGAGVGMALSVDERTVYLVGDDALVVVPLP